VRPTRPRDRIISAATRLFNREGIRGVGVNQIIEEADVAPMTLYRQFGGKDQLVAATVGQWSAQWLRWLNTDVERRGGDPEQRLAALWDALEYWFAAEDFRGSFVDNTASELRGAPDHPAHEMISAHRAAMHQLLEDLAERTGATDPARLTAQLQVLVDGAVAAAAVDRQPAVAPGVRALASAALAAAGSRAA